VKILLDECLPVDFRHSFINAQTVEWAGPKGKKNGELLLAAETAGYDVLLTVDQGIPREHTLFGRKLSVILIRSRTNQLEDLLPLVNLIREALATIQPGQEPVGDRICIKYFALQ
jgi:predicted nuclease of predicted toxin-antitoxin system